MSFFCALSFIATLLFSTSALAHPDRLKNEMLTERVIAIGMRMREWQSFENSKRLATVNVAPPNGVADDPSIESKPEAISIEDPLIYNPELTNEELELGLKAIPANALQVLTGSGPFPAELGLSKTQFDDLALSVNSAYDHATRWKDRFQSVESLKNDQYLDLRGFYYLRKLGWTAEKFSHFDDENQTTQSQLLNWLKEECLNSKKSRTLCTLELNLARTNHSLPDFFHRYHPQSEALWNSFFTISPEDQRRDILWTSLQPFTFAIHFENPASNAIRKFLVDNIEDEWKMGPFKIHLEFGHYAFGPRIRFEPGILPSVDQVGGNSITLDQSVPLEDLDSRTTIRHEFGHVLGFKDCYVEFYDAELEAFVNYQLDPSDLMCSPAGSFTPAMFAELKRTYYTP